MLALPERRRGSDNLLGVYRQQRVYLKERQYSVWNERLDYTVCLSVFLRVRWM